MLHLYDLHANEGEQWFRIYPQVLHSCLPLLILAFSSKVAEKRFQLDRLAFYFTQSKKDSQDGLLDGVHGFDALDFGGSIVLQDFLFFCFGRI